MLKLSQRLSTKTSFIILFLVSLISLIFLGTIYYILNIQGATEAKTYLSNTKAVTSEPTTLNLNLLEPDDDLLTFKSSVLISGKTLPFMDVLISSSSLDKVIKSKADGSFSMEISLDEGVNIVTILVFDSSAEQKSTSRTIYYSKEKI